MEVAFYGRSTFYLCGPVPNLLVFLSRRYRPECHTWQHGHPRRFIRQHGGCWDTSLKGAGIEGDMIFPSLSYFVLVFQNIMLLLSAEFLAERRLDVWLFGSFVPLADLVGFYRCSTFSLASRLLMKAGFVACSNRMSFHGRQERLDTFSQFVVIRAKPEFQEYDSSREITRFFPIIFGLFCFYSSTITRLAHSMAWGYFAVLDCIVKSHISGRSTMNNPLWHNLC